MYSHNVWFMDSAEQQYHVTLRFNYVKGPWGFIQQLIRFLVIGVYVPFAIIFYLKSKGHDNASYYSAIMVVSPGHPLYEEKFNSLKFENEIREMKVKSGDNDVLGRSNIILINFRG